MSETREWTKGSPKAIGTYAIEFADGSVDLAYAYGDAGHIYVNPLVRSSHMSGEITRHCGPLTTDELLAGIPKPPPRLPKAHPDRYLARLCSLSSGGSYSWVETQPNKGRVTFAPLDVIGACDPPYVGKIAFHPTRRAQQDTDGVWREVDV